MKGEQTVLKCKYHVGYSCKKKGVMLENGYAVRCHCVGCADFEMKE